MSKPDGRSSSNTNHRLTMSRRIADLLIKIGADSYEFQQKAQQVERNLGSLEKRLTSLGKSLSVKLTAPLAALGAVALKNADTQQQAEQRLITALKGRTDIQQRLIAQAAELQSRSVLGDEVVIGQQAYLASLGMTEEQIGRVIEASAQLSAATGMTLDSAVKNLAKTFGGLTGELGESIPKLKELTVEQLKNGEAVDFILENYKGFAESAAQTALGPLRQLNNAWGDFLEQIGAAMMPFATKVTRALTVVVQMLQSLSPTMKQVLVVVAGLAAAIGPLSLGIGAVIKVLPMLSAGLTALLSPVGLVVAAIVALGAAFAYARIEKQKMIDEMAESDSLEELERKLRDNLARQKAVIDETTRTRLVPNFGGLVAGFTIQKVPDESQLAPLRREYELLTAAIEKKREAEKKAADAQAEMDRITEQVRQQTEELMASMNAAADNTDQTTGIIGRLQKQIEELEKRKLLPESTLEDIAAANTEITRLREELQRIQDLTPGQLTRPTFGSLLPEGVELELPAPELKMADLAPIASDWSRQMQLLFASVREGLYGWADDTESHLGQNLLDTVAMVDNYTTALTARGWSFSAALEHVHGAIAEVMQRFDQQVSKFMADSIVAAAEAIGQVITGDLGFGGLMKAILTQFASFLKNIGTQLIEFGVMILAFKSALRSVLWNPWAAIAIGAAMVAAAAVMTALINKNAGDSVPALAAGGLAYGPTYAMVGDNPNARTDPEVIAPLSRLQSMLPTAGAAQQIQITLGGQLTAKGRDLVYVLGKENFKSEVLGG
nr:MAG TPA: minor tail protein [Caudoviricetes sp.]